MSDTPEESSSDRGVSADSGRDAPDGEVLAEDVELVDRLFGLLDDDDELEGDVTKVEFGSCEEALEDAIGSLEAVTAERDEYLAVAQRVQADFENYKRRVDSQRIDQVRRAAEGLVAELLPVLDACDAAVSHGIEDVVPIYNTLFGTLEKQGLERIDQIEVAFDPNLHEAVMSEDGEGIDDGPAVAEVLRSGYQWNGRVVRPAMVKVRG